MKDPLKEFAELYFKAEARGLRQADGKIYMREEDIRILLQESSELISNGKIISLSSLAKYLSEHDKSAMPTTSLVNRHNTRLYGWAKKYNNEQRKGVVLDNSLFCNNLTDAIENYCNVAIKNGLSLEEVSQSLNSALDRSKNYFKSRQDSAKLLTFLKESGLGKESALKILKDLN